jgi:hypothetical protein
VFLCDEADVLARSLETTVVVLIRTAVANVAKETREVNHLVEQGLSNSVLVTLEVFGHQTQLRETVRRAVLPSLCAEPTECARAHAAVGLDSDYREWQMQFLWSKPQFFGKGDKQPFEFIDRRGYTCLGHVGVFHYVSVSARRGSGERWRRSNAPVRNPTNGNRETASRAQTEPERNGTGRGSGAG